MSYGLAPPSRTNSPTTLSFFFPPSNNLLHLLQYYILHIAI